MFLKRKVRKYLLFKGYLLVKKTNVSEFLQQFVFPSIECRDLNFKTYSINYGNDKKFKISKLLKEVMNTQRFEYFDAWIDDELFMVSLSKVFFGEDAYYKVTFCLPDNFQILDSLESLPPEFDFQYAYLRLLNSDYSPQTELKYKIGLFGGKTAIVNGANHGWLDDPESELLNGGIKGVYSVNILQINSSRRLMESLGSFSELAEVRQINGKLQMLKFSDEALNSIKNAEILISKYVYPNIH